MRCFTRLPAEGSSAHGVSQSPGVEEPRLPGPRPAWRSGIPDEMGQAGPPRGRVSWVEAPGIKHSECALLSNLTGEKPVDRKIHSFKS